MAALEAELRKVGLHLRPDKCKSHIPGASPQDAAQRAHEFAGVADLVTGGLPVLGTVSRGEYKTVVGNSAEAAQPATERLQAAKELAEAIKEMLEAPIEGPRVAPAWKLTSAVVNNALSYDSCILSPVACRPLAEELDSTVASLVAAIAKAEMDSDAISQARLPRSSGGCGLPSAAERCSTAFLSTFLRCPPPADMPPEAWEQTGLTTAAAEAAREVAGMGAHIDAWGMSHAAAPRCKLDVFSVAREPMTHRQRGWWLTIGRLRAAKWAQHPVHGERIVQCAGDEGGVFLLATASEMGFSLEDDEFRTGLRMRLGLDVCRPGYCQHVSRRQQGRGPVCGAALDGKGLHATMCKVAGEVNVLHDSGCQIILGAARAAGFHGLAEQVVPELRTAARKEPRLDIEAWGHPAQPRLLLDFTVRDPAASRYADLRSEPAGTAAQGEREKAKEYPALGGVSVRGLCMERLGRHGPGLAQLLHELADMARRRDADRGQAPRRWLKIWRSQLSGVAVRSRQRAVATAVEDRRGRSTEHGPRAMLPSEV